jgi:hypothetical protein
MGTRVGMYKYIKTIIRCSGSLFLSPHHTPVDGVILLVNRSRCNLLDQWMKTMPPFWNLTKVDHPLHLYISNQYKYNII